MFGTDEWYVVEIQHERNRIWLKKINEPEIGASVLMKEDGISCGSIRYPNVCPRLITTVEMVA